MPLSKEAHASHTWMDLSQSNGAVIRDVLGKYDVLFFRPPNRSGTRTPQWRGPCLCDTWQRVLSSSVCEAQGWPVTGKLGVADACPVLSDPRDPLWSPLIGVPVCSHLGSYPVRSFQCLLGPCLDCSPCRIPRFLGAVEGLHCTCVPAVRVKVIVRPFPVFDPQGDVRDVLLCRSPSAHKFLRDHLQVPCCFHCHAVLLLCGVA